MDKLAKILGIAVFVLHSLLQVINAPNFQYSFINHFGHTFQLEDIYVRKLYFNTFFLN